MAVSNMTVTTTFLTTASVTSTAGRYAAIEITGATSVVSMNYGGKYDGLGKVGAHPQGPCSFEGGGWGSELVGGGYVKIATILRIYVWRKSTLNSRS